MEWDQAWLLDLLGPAGLVVGQDDDGLVQVDIGPFQEAGFTGPGSGVTQEDEQLPALFTPDLARIHAGGRQLLALIAEYFDE